MSILFVGALAEEFTNGNLVTTPAAAFDAQYAPGALAVTLGDNVLLMTSKTLNVGATDVWLHCNYYQAARQTSVDDSRDLLGIYGASGRRLAAIGGAWAGANAGMFLKLGPGYTTRADVYNLLPIGKRVALDMHYTSNGTTESVQLYVDGLQIATLSVASTYNDGVVDLRMGSLLTASQAYFSELIVTGGGESTIGWRLGSMGAVSDGSLTEWTGSFTDLSTADTTTGIWTDMVNKVHTGEFEPYSGEANPLGIRALVQVGRYVENSSGLTLQGVLYDTAIRATYNQNFTDESRVITVWDTNPVTAADWEPADFASFEGGFKSLAA